MNKIKEELLKIINELEENFICFSEFLDFPSKDNFSYFSCQSDIEESDKIKVFSGESKGVIVFTDNCFLKKYVVKIPFLYTREIACLEENYVEFHDDCAIEEAIYRRLLKDSLNEHFAPCKKILTLNRNSIEVPIYLMERHDADSEKNSWIYAKIDFKQSYGKDYDSSNKEDTKNMKEILDALEYSGEDFLFWYLSLVNGESYAESFMKILDNYGINDMHSGNVSIDEDGDFHIIDYSGY